MRTERISCILLVVVKAYAMIAGIFHGQPFVILELECKEVFNCFLDLDFSQGRFVLQQFMYWVVRFVPRFTNFVAHN